VRSQVTGHRLHHGATVATGIAAAKAILGASNTRLPACGCACCRSRRGNSLGPLLLGRFFDTIGLKVMISETCNLSGSQLAVTAGLFCKGTLSAATRTMAWAALRSPLLTERNGLPGRARNHRRQAFASRSSPRPVQRRARDQAGQQARGSPG
jgi:hypothetical protein